MKKEEIGFLGLFGRREPLFFILIVSIITTVSGWVSLSLVESESIRPSENWLFVWAFIGYLSCVIFALLSKRMFISYR